MSGCGQTSEEELQGPVVMMEDGIKKNRAMCGVEYT